MKNRITWFLTLILALSMLLSACGTPAGAEEPPPPEPVETDGVAGPAIGCSVASGEEDGIGTSPDCGDEIWPSCRS